MIHIMKCSFKNKIDSKSIIKSLSAQNFTVSAEETQNRWKAVFLAARERKEERGEGNRRWWFSSF